MRRPTFLDRQLLQFYFDEIKRTVPLEKRREIGGELGLTGPKVHFTQKEQTSQLSDAELIAAVIEGHAKKGTLLRGRPLKEGPRLVLERCRAVRVEVPNAINEPNADPPIVMWVSLGEGPGTFERPTSGTLCVLEKYQGPDLRKVSRPSEYSIFAELILALALDGRKNLLAERLGMTRLDRIDGNSAWEKGEETLEPFTKDPVGILTRLGCKAGRARAIEVLYEIRQVSPDWGSEFRTVTVFGYAIAVSNDA